MEKTDKRIGSTKANKPVIQYSLDGVFIKEYDSIKQAIEETGITNISFAARGILKTSGKCKWKFKTDTDISKFDSKEL